MRSHQGHNGSISLPGKALPSLLSQGLKSQRFEGMTEMLAQVGTAEVTDWGEPLMCKQLGIKEVLVLSLGSGTGSTIPWVAQHSFFGRAQCYHRDLC